MSHVIQFGLALLICVTQTADAADRSLVYTGVNIAGGEFAPKKLPGVFDRDYTYPQLSIDRLLRDQGNEHHSRPSAVGANSASIGRRARSELRWRVSTPLSIRPHPGHASDHRCP